MKSMEEFIEKNRGQLDECIRRVCPYIELDDDDREDWILNDEGLYNWARGEGVDV